ncbi:MAG: fumarate [Prolixibacteraceae bacterium]|nr:MAG: fumarate [Prolixibacteraceae bacterium]
MNFATISSDVISYTSLSDEAKRKLENSIKRLLSELSEKYKEQGFFGRLVQGDYIECVINSPKDALRIGLLLKTFIKSLDLNIPNASNNKLKYFFEHGIRMAIAVAPLLTIDPQNGIIDGDAIYLSGRTIKNLSTSDKQKIVIKNTMFFCSPDEKLQEQFDTIFSLIDTILSRYSAKQSEVIYYKLQNLSEKDISSKLKKYQSTISQHSTAAGWLSIEKVINYFEKTVS